MIKPLEDRVLVKMEDEPDVTESGIILKSATKEKPQTAIVLEVGPGIKKDGKFEPMEVKKGDRVILNKYSGTEVKYLGEELLIVKDKDILAIIEEE